MKSEVRFFCQIEAIYDAATPAVECSLVLHVMAGGLGLMHLISSPGGCVVTIVGHDAESTYARGVRIAEVAEKMNVAAVVTTGFNDIQSWMLSKGVALHGAKEE